MQEQYDKNTGVIILAAGLSSRMGAFKPLLPYQGSSICFHLIEKYSKAGCCPIVIVTGRDYQLLQEKVSMEYEEKYGFSIEEKDTIHFVHNKEYESSDMLNSITYGVKAIRGKCDRFFLTPVDICSYQLETIKALMAAESMVVKPGMNHRSGHPILLSNKMIDNILAYNGEHGLKDILRSYRDKTIYVEVKDKGIMFDLDTPKDYQMLIES